jgi:exopolysaccharide biosynthesis polyprenyl glycosylphosphotransferase
VSDQLASLPRADAASSFEWLADSAPRVRRRSDSVWVLARVFADTAMLALATLVTGATGLQSMGSGWRILATLLTLGALAGAGTYTQRLRLDLPRELIRVLAATALALMALGSVALLFRHHTGNGDALLLHWSTVATLIVTARIGINYAQRAARTHASALGATVIVGAGHVGHTIARRLLADPSLGLKPIGFLDKEPLLVGSDRGLGAPELPVLGASWDLEEVLERHHVEHVVVAFSTAPTEVTLDVVRRCWQRGVNVMLVPRLFEVEGRRMEVEHLGAMPLVTVRSSDPRGRRYAIKYALDRVFGTLAIVLLSPLLALIALAVLVTMGRPIFFRQKRVGLDGKVFDMLKFRTMSGDPSQAGQWNEAWATAMAKGSAASFAAPVAPGDRRTPLGTLLRATSMDELAQLWNVVRGEMSIVGPRPEQLAYVELFEHAIARYPERHRVKAGLTGWAQINGLRGDTSLADRIEWDNFYVENWSPWLDVQILLRTIPALVTRRGR